MPEVTIDTTVIFRANVPLTGDRASARLLSKRLALLRRLQSRDLVAFMSPSLLDEYVRQILPAKNEVTKAFLDLVASPDGTRVIWNWKNSWSGGERARARACRYPAEDDHVLRTAIRDTPTTIYTEETRMLQANRCVYREFRVHIVEP